MLTHTHNQILLNEVLIESHILVASSNWTQRTASFHQMSNSASVHVCSMSALQTAEFFSHKGIWQHVPEKIFNKPWMFCRGFFTFPQVILWASLCLHVQQRNTSTVSMQLQWAVRPHIYRWHCLKENCRTSGPGLAITKVPLYSVTGRMGQCPQKVVNCGSLGLTYDKVFGKPLP